MKKRWSVATLLVICLASTNISQIADAANAKAGAKCSKVGTTQSHSGKKFTCIKSGSKLVWNKGVVLTKNPTPKISPTPTPTPTVEVVLAKVAKEGLGCYTKNEEAFSLSGPLICTNGLWTVVQRESDSIQSRAFRYVLERWNKQPEGNLTIDFYIDQTSGDWVYEIEMGLRAGARFWGTSEPGSKPIPAFISDNPTFIEESLVKAGIKQSIEDRDRNRNARGGQAGFHGGENSYWDFLFKNPSSRTNVGYFQVAPHEYTHYAQAQLGAKGDWSAAGPWFNEGLASFIGSALGPMNKMPHNQMDDWRGSLSPSMTTPLAFFNENTQSVYRSSMWSDVYPLGALATQAVVALVGVEAVISFYQDLGALNDKEAAYKKNFKLESDDLVTVLQGYINSIKIRKEWSLETLETEYKKAIAKS
jgi:hypothetical protein